VITIALQNSSLTIHALFVPDLTYNLLSVSYLSAASQISFRNGSCFIKYKSSDKEELAAFQDGLYHVPVGAPGKKTSLLATALTTSLPSFTLWHQWSANLSDKTLASLVPQEVYKRDEEEQERICQVCIKAKHTRKFERKLQSQATKPFELLHSDLGDPISPLSKLGFRYFIICIDDYTRVSWVYFLRTKTSTEVVSVFQHLQARIEKEYPTWPITRFRCDNGRGEYDNLLFRGILRICCITFEPSPPIGSPRMGFPSA